MGRWQPDARGRLQQAAMTLFIERGYDEVTVTDIAERAGLTKRSFFNHFADKREVMFANYDPFQAGVLAALATATSDLDPLDAAVWAFTQAAEAMFADFAELARARKTLIDSSPELHERDLMKTAAVTSAIAGALVQRGAPRRDAAFAAQAATIVFTTAYDEWAQGPERGLAASIREALHDLRAVLGTNGQVTRPLEPNPA
jgi:AcrR family transcriptional regulator